MEIKMQIDVLISVGVRMDLKITKNEVKECQQTRYLLYDMLNPKL